MIKVSMCGSAIAMVIPSLGITLEMPRYMLTAGWNPHEPASLFLALALISPVAGITGWALGSLAGLGWRSWVQLNDRM